VPELNGIPLWYAIRTRSRHEKQVRDRFVALGIEQLLPTVKRLNQWKDRKKEIESPLFQDIASAGSRGRTGCRC